MQVSYSLVSQISTKKIYGRLRQQFGEMMRDLCRQKGVELIEGHACPDHVHMCLNIPPKYSVSSIVGFLKGKSAIRLNKEFSKAKSTGKQCATRASIFARNCTKDEGKSLGVGLQEQAPNHLKLLW
jgi:REP element-mobilizing transposase RayT